MVLELGISVPYFIKSKAALIAECTIFYVSLTKEKNHCQISNGMPSTLRYSFIADSEKCVC